MESSEPIRLLILLKSLNIGGIERSTIVGCNMMAKNLGLIAIWTENGILSQLVKQSQKLKIISRKRSIASTFFFISNLLQLVRIIKKHRISIIHYHFRIFLPYIIFIKLVFPRIKIIYTHHSVFNDYLTKYLYADKYIAISKATQIELEKNKKKCVLIRHGIELSQSYDPIRDKAIKNIGYVGRFHRSKGIITLIKAFKMLIPKYPSIRLTMYGEGKQKGEILDFIEKNHLQSNIIINNPLIKMVDVYSQIDLLVMPSINLEGFGLVIIEAMAFGIPVIASDLEVFKEIIIDDFNGKLFMKNNISDLCHKIDQLLQKPEKVNIICTNGIDTVSRHFDINHQHEKYLKILNEN